MPQILFWLAATVIFLLIEWPTMGLTTIWFAGGSLVAGLLAVFSCPLDFPVTGSTVVGDQVLLVFSDALETDFCRIFTASMLTKGE